MKAVNVGTFANDEVRRAVDWQVREQAAKALWDTHNSWRLGVFDRLLGLVAPARPRWGWDD